MILNWLKRLKCKHSVIIRLKQQKIDNVLIMNYECWQCGKEIVKIK